MSADRDALVAQIKEQAQVFASAWSLVGGKFDSGNMLSEANGAKAELHAMLDRLAAPASKPDAMLHAREGAEDDDSLAAAYMLGRHDASRAPSATSVPASPEAVQRPQQIEAWTWFDAAGNYRLERDEPPEWEKTLQLTPLVALSTTPGGAA